VESAQFVCTTNLGDRMPEHPEAQLLQRAYFTPTATRESQSFDVRKVDGAHRSEGSVADQASACPKPTSSAISRLSTTTDSKTLSRR
jgi:hypothetical protein